MAGFEVRLMQDAIEKAAQLTAAFDSMADRFKEVAESLERWRKSPAVRRMALEQKLGYRIPDWVWRVEEQQRQQFGSGNGRKMRE